MSIPTLRSLDHTTIKTQGSKGGAFTPPLVGVPHRPQGAPIAAPLENPRLYTARFARWGDVFQVHLLSTAKCRRLGGAFAAGFKP